MGKWEYSRIFNRVALNPGLGGVRDVTSTIDISLMNRLNQTESAIFKLWMLYFQRIPFQIIWFRSFDHFNNILHRLFFDKVFW